MLVFCKFCITFCWIIADVCRAQERVTEYLEVQENFQVTQTPEAEVVGLRQELAELKSEMADLKERFRDLTNRNADEITEVKRNVIDLKEDFRDLTNRSVAEMVEVKRNASLNLLQNTSVLRGMVTEALTKSTAATEIAAEAVTKANRAEQEAKSATGLQRQTSANYNSQIQTVKQSISGIRNDLSAQSNTGRDERKRMNHNIEMVQKKFDKNRWITLVYEEGMSMADRYGRLEVYHDGKWGTVCDDDFGEDDADVACRQLGYSSSHRYETVSSKHQGSGKIWLDGLRCSGNERTLQSCGGNGWGDNNCEHSEDIILSCY